MAQNPTLRICGLALGICLTAALGNAQELVQPPAGEAIAGDAAASLPPMPTVAAPPKRPSMVQILSNARKDFCTKVRESPVGQLVGGLRKPLSLATGGVVPAEKAPGKDAQAQPGPQGTAAQIKAVQLQAAKRQSGIEALAGLDVRYHPEAEATLIAALRADPSQCVRLAAAETMTTLPVCTPKLAEALKVCVEGTNVDGNPAELSERVRMQAEAAWSHCLSCQPPGAKSPRERPEYPVVPAGGVAAADRLGRNQPATANAAPVSEVQTAIFQQDLSPPVAQASGSQPDAARWKTPPRRVSNPERQPKRPRSLFDVLRFAAEPQEK